MIVDSSDQLWWYSDKNDDTNSQSLGVHLSLVGHATDPMLNNELVETCHGQATADATAEQSEAVGLVNSQPWVVIGESHFQMLNSFKLLLTIQIEELLVISEKVQSYLMQIHMLHVLPCREVVRGSMFGLSSMSRRNSLYATRLVVIIVSVYIIQP